MSFPFSNDTCVNIKISNEIPENIKQKIHNFFTLKFIALKKKEM